MRSFLENKRLILVFSILALGALTVLAIGLSDIPFRGAQSFRRENDAGNLRAVSQNFINSIVDIPFWQQMSVWVLILIMIVLISALLSREMRKRLILIIIRVGITYWALYIIFTRYRDMLLQIGLDPNAADNGNASTSASVPPPAFIPPQTISLTSYLVSFGIAVLLVILAWKLFRIWKEYTASNASMPLHKIAGIARSSLHDLSSGRDSTDVIMNCYFRMSDVVESKRNLSRGKAVTPAEFASRLEQAGLPSDAVYRLTRLFERVRYGGHRSGTPEVNEAVACLTTILQHCGEAV
ncbi:MAG: DUF4129 domain-containing protein [Anaerolineae bacterium]|nr:DUF4129 domain-containing protein [Anaerolineae bacterium]MCI0608849.1 DUF4129 domain-containing protein [Anaerolineae bacterium]